SLHSFSISSAISRRTVAWAPDSVPAAPASRAGRRQRWTNHSTSTIPSPSATQGMIQASRLKPDLVGLASTWVPYSCTNDCSTRASESVEVARCTISARNWVTIGQPTWLHTIAPWVHPQGQMSCSPIRRARPPNCCAPSPTTSAINRMAGTLDAALSRKRGFLLRVWRRQGDRRGPRSELAVGQQRDQGSKYDDEGADPDPHDERVQIGVQNGLLAGGIIAGIDQVQILERARANCHHGLGLVRGFVEAPRGIHRGHILAAALDPDDLGFARKIRIVVLGVALGGQGVRANSHRGSVGHRRLDILIEGGSGDP